MSGSRYALCVGCACLLWLCAWSVRADDAELARLSFERGVAASEAGDWQRAQREFQASQQRAPKASTLFNLALAELRLGRFEQALSTLAAFDALAEPDVHQHLIDRAGAVGLEAEAMATRARLMALEQSLQASRAQPPAAPPDDTRALGRGLIGAGALLAGSAIGAGLWWRDRAKNVDACHLPGGVTCREEHEIARQRRAAAGLTVALAVTALGLVVTGTVWLATRAKGRGRLAQASGWQRPAGVVLRF